MTTHQQIEAAFVAAATCTEDHFGKWIPSTYWVEKVKRKLRKEITTKQLYKALQATNCLRRQFATPEDQLKYGNIVMIDNIETRLVVGGHTTKRTLVRVG